MNRTKLTLLHFDSASDLLHGISALQHHRIPICEVYAPKHIPGMEAKLRIKQLRLGYAVLKFGCLGGMAVTTLAGNLLERDSLLKLDGKSVFALLFTAFIMLVTYLLATRLFPRRVPKVMEPGLNDNRYLIVVDAKSTIANEAITNLFKYAGAVEISAAIKNIVLS